MRYLDKFLQRHKMKKLFDMKRCNVIKACFTNTQETHSP